jgi:hypothetical protein
MACATLIIYKGAIIQEACLSMERTAIGIVDRSIRSMIYVDTSVVLAQLLTEDRIPSIQLWQETLVSSRLLIYELWTRIHARGLAESHGELARQITGRIAFLELTQTVLARALEPFPAPIRTLDALHLASLEFIRNHGGKVELSSYDDKMIRCARLLHIPICKL